MKQSCRFLSLFLILTMLVGVFAACSAPANKPESSVANPGSAAKTSTVESQQPAPEKLKGTVDVWTWEPQENQQAVIDDFNKAYPDITVEFTTVASGDMPMKIQTALASDSDLPDVVWCEISNRGKMMALDCWEDLTQAPYDLDKSQMLDYQIPLSETPSGKLVGIEVSTPVAGLAYKRDLAKEYLGTDDPDELAEKIQTWEDMLKLGEEVLEKSNGEVKLFTHVSGPFNILMGQNQEPFIIDNKLNLKDSLGEAFEMGIAMQKAGVVDTIEAGTPAEDAAISGSNHIFFGCPTWAPTWKYKVKDPEGSGNWGLMIPPGGGYMNGGTVVAIPSKAEDKEAAFAYVNWCYYTIEGAVSNRDNLDYMSAYKPVYEDEEFYSVEDEFFGGQNVLKTYAQSIIPSTAVPRKVHQYDMEVNDAVLIAMKAIADSKGDITVDQILADITNEVINKVPELATE